MKLIPYIERINKLHYLISIEKTGLPKHLAQQLHLSERRLSSIIEELRLQNVPIGYCRTRETYYYTQPFLMEASLKFIKQP